MLLSGADKILLYAYEYAFASQVLVQIKQTDGKIHLNFLNISEI